MTRPRGRELLGFATVGLLAYATDLALFTWLRGPAGLGPLTAKGLSFVAGCAVAYAGNALGTYRHTRARGVRPYAVFFAVNLAGALVQLLCLTVSHYCLGFTSPYADTVSGAGIGMAPATIVRFWGTRTLVFGVDRGADGRADRIGGEAEGRFGSWTG
ncbi:membrane protein [Streptomyces chromofuscus]|uniref:GtrA family protein n=1 Tax=Streptomyces chromofuscus TaxID=42881 RepID=A0A7M2T1I4_STRCW|nr:GtrA family protein [Streptomyces chromofuscus]QOV42527.1 GtrA family protein [Streptomyces chromofuscus]GGT30836.1 membrane protein [Streptomyces chromofuscus]